MPLERHIATYGQEIETLATIDIGAMWDRMLGEFLQEWVNINRNNVPAPQMERELIAFMENLSENHEAGLARRSSTIAYNQGRAAEIKSAADEKRAEYVTRSEILDEATCEPCSRYERYPEFFEIGSQEFYDNQPPRYCDGGTNCRGFYVVVPNEMAA